MKKIFKIMSLVLMIVLAIGVLAACNDKATDETPGPDNGNTDPGNTDNGNEAPAGEGPFDVTFMYIDPQGTAMKDPEGKTERVHRKVKLGKDAKNTVIDDPQVFENYVIIGWNADKAQAMAGVADDAATKNITSNKILYSVVRAKHTFTVTFKNADGQVFKTLPMQEGSEIDDSIERPVKMGTYFKTWVVEGEGVASDTSCIRDNCTFIATVGITDGTIGKVAAGSIEVDGIKDAAYMTSGAYLPLNTTLQSDRSESRAKATVDADTYLVWDGEYIYMLLEVSDKSLVGRADAYRKGGVDAYLNDTVEIWYNFEQDTTQTTNQTRVGIDAMGASKYALPRCTHGDKATGIGGGRSTHYDDIEFAVRNNVKGDFGTDLSRTGYVGNATWTEGVGEEPKYMASYIMEIKFPAWTEGAADISQGADPKTGLLPGKIENSTNSDDYAFTPGTQLREGDFVRFSVQINDLMIPQAEMTGATKTYFWDCAPLAKVQADWAGYATAKPEQLRSMLYATDGAGKITGMADTSDLFSSSGATQRDLPYYVMFSLSNNEKAETIVTALGSKTVDSKVVPTMLKADGTEYVRK